ncbi:endonuclease MutS2 [Parasphaerochaeta coccoides]|uniref:Endonuclease MutS2 n=1 Tax=Parasphaerochaeta coccoides (strain ATCC BAA-1237 / DSM 17374 / SPN1) TaxID=760011 RepID=F4GIH5_PARC1|nr:Smr/MutS family protein [Parasphaerochaeta coccoides]AEC01683.1 DNA mismatch repair protein MutS domain protein [Parasphaerochaeta coccoides DSM 17374]
MHTRTLEDLGFTTVTTSIATHALSSEGKEELSRDRFVRTADEWEERQLLVGDIMRLRQDSLRPAPSGFPDISGILNLLDRPAAVLAGEDIYTVGGYIAAAREFKAFCEEQDEGKAVNPAAGLFTAFPVTLAPVEKEIFSIMESPGTVKKSHPELAKLLRDVERIRGERQAYSREFLLKNSQSVRNDQPVLRDGRLVIPMRSDQSSTVTGFVHGSSASGATTFMEPFPLVGLNNNVVLAEQKVQMCIARILSALSATVKAVLDDVKVLQCIIGEADALYACASWAGRNRCVVVHRSDDIPCRLVGARHPLLGSKAVPVTVDIPPGIDGVVFSGPNAGGKTVTIKTVGLFALLNQFCGYVPAEEGTSLPLFDGIFSDIGDDQSIEKEFSTFSGHLHRIGFIMKEATPRSLIILDELGSGTDPAEGAALARAILEYCLDHAFLTLVTSHHGVLKQYAYGSDRLLNAAMEFDEEFHRPTFRVVSGISGESHAIETARRMDLPSEVIVAAQKYLGTEAVRISTIIRDLEEKQRRARQMEEEMAQDKKALESALAQARERSRTLLEEEVRVREDGMAQLSSYIADTRKSLENLIADLRHGEISREKTLRAKQFIADLQEKEKKERDALVSRKDRQRTFNRTQDATLLTEGMDVLVGTARKEGRLLRKKGKNSWEVSVGVMRMVIDEKDIHPVRRRETPVSVISYATASPRPSPILDVRGMTLDQALEEVSRRVEACIVHDMSGFEIIHGYGDGILAQGIGNFLDSFPAVKKRFFARPEEGGMGKTYVEL